MYGRLNEDVAWTRLQDRQREMENRRFGADGDHVRIGVMRSLGGWLGQAVRSAVRRVPRRRQAAQFEACDAVRDVA